MASSNPELTSRLVVVFDRCLAVQLEHLAGLRAGNLDNIDQWVEERQLMIACLRQTLAEVQPAGLDADLRSLLLEKIGSILDTEKLLFSFAEQQRATLADKLTTLRRGKRALSRYGSARNRPPQFVSDKG